MTDSNPTAQPPAAAPAPAPRPVRDTVCAILNLIVAAGMLPWLAAQVLVLIAAERAGGAGTGVRTVTLLAILTGTAVAVLVVGAVGLLRRARWAHLAIWTYVVLGVGAALLIWLAGGRVWLASVLLLYPVALAVVYSRPPAER